MGLEIAAVVGGLALILAVIIVLIARALIIICPPNRLAVISGRQRVLPDGRIVGYRILKGGRALRVPLLEKVDWLYLNTIPLEIAGTHTYQSGSMAVQCTANVKVSSREDLVMNAAEHFLNVHTDAIGQIAKETLETSLSGFLVTLSPELATLSPEEVNKNQLNFSQQFIDKANDDINELGLELNQLKIQKWRFAKPQDPLVLRGRTC